MSEKIRFQVDLTPELSQELDNLGNLTGTTRSETFRNALRFYGWLIHDVEAGATIQVVKDGQVHMSFPASMVKGVR